MNKNSFNFKSFKFLHSSMLFSNLSSFHPLSTSPSHHLIPAPPQPRCGYLRFIPSVPRLFSDGNACFPYHLPWMTSLLNSRSLPTATNVLAWFWASMILLGTLWNSDHRPWVTCKTTLKDGYFSCLRASDAQVRENLRRGNKQKGVYEKSCWSSFVLTIACLYKV